MVYEGPSKSKDFTLGKGGAIVYQGEDKFKHRTSKIQNPKLEWNNPTSEPNSLKDIKHNFINKPLKWLIGKAESKIHNQPFFTNRIDDETGTMIQPYTSTPKDKPTATIMDKPSKTYTAQEPTIITPTRITPSGEAAELKKLLDKTPKLIKNKIIKSVINPTKKFTENVINYSLNKMEEFNNLMDEVITYSEKHIHEKKAKPLQIEGTPPQPTYTEYKKILNDKKAEFNETEKMLEKPWEKLNKKLGIGFEKKFNYPQIDDEQKNGWNNNTKPKQKLKDDEQKNGWTNNTKPKWEEGWNNDSKQKWEKLNDTIKKIGRYDNRYYHNGTMKDWGRLDLEKKREDFMIAFAKEVLKETTGMDWDKLVSDDYETSAKHVSVLMIAKSWKYLNTLVARSIYQLGFRRILGLGPPNTVAINDNELRFNGRIRQMAVRILREYI